MVPSLMLNNIDITKLPPDAKKDFMKYAIKLTQKRKQSTLSKDFLSFVKAMWPQFIEGPHHKIIAQKFNDIADGKIKRLIINMPPRHTKSEFASYLLPSWMVGRKPDLKIIQRPTPLNSRSALDVKQKRSSIRQSISKFLIPRSAKIQRRLENGKPRRAGNTTPRAPDRR